MKPVRVRSGGFLWLWVKLPFWVACGIQTVHCLVTISIMWITDLSQSLSCEFGPSNLLWILCPIMSRTYAAITVLSLYATIICIPNMLYIHNMYSYTLFHGLSLVCVINLLYSFAWFACLSLFCLTALKDHHCALTELSISQMNLGAPEWISSITYIIFYLNSWLLIVGPAFEYSS